MKRTLIAALVPLLAAPVVIASGVTTAGAADSTGACALPTAERSYTHDQLVYRLALDLTGCGWWDGSPVRLDANLDRFDATESHGAGSFVMCSSLDAVPGQEGPDAAPSGAAAATGSDNGPNPAPPALRSGACAVEISVDHPATEAARYKGDITFPWEDGTRTVSFNALCGPAAGCVDLPVDPTAVFAPAADLYDAISGDSHAG